MVESDSSVTSSYLFGLLVAGLLVIDALVLLLAVFW